MSTCLAEVLFGHMDRDNRGILFNNRISVYENHATRLVFEKRATREGAPGSIEGMWIPNPDYLIESCLLMAAVYGTLMSGKNNHSSYLANSKLLGEAEGYAMYSVSSFPGIVPEHDEKVKGEVYDIDEYTLRKLDMLEGEGSLYIRKMVKEGIREVYPNIPKEELDSYLKLIIKNKLLIR